jgi:hypothetical protein
VVKNSAKQLSGFYAWFASSGPKLNTKPPNANTQQVAEMLSVITRQILNAVTTRAAAATTIAA